jgi:hypothetical protein
VFFCQRNGKTKEDYPEEVELNCERHGKLLELARLLKQARSYAYRMAQWSQY